MGAEVAREDGIMITRPEFRSFSNPHTRKQDRMRKGSREVMLERPWLAIASKTGILGIKELRPRTPLERH
jgi:hypothetical protein